MTASLFARRAWVKRLRSRFSKKFLKDDKHAVMRLRKFDRDGAINYEKYGINTRARSDSPLFSRADAQNAGLEGARGINSRGKGRAPRENRRDMRGYGLSLTTFARVFVKFYPLCVVISYCYLSASLFLPQKPLGSRRISRMYSRPG
jgi:hypothetical protein